MQKETFLGTRFPECLESLIQQSLSNFLSTTNGHEVGRFTVQSAYSRRGVIFQLFFCDCEFIFNVV
jgi:hypothetical protein